MGTHRCLRGDRDLRRIADKFLNGIDNVRDGSNALELVRLDSFASDFLQSHDEIDGVDAIEIEIFVQPRLRGDIRLLNVEEGVKFASDVIENVVS